MWQNRKRLNLLSGRVSKLEKELRLLKFPAKYKINDTVIVEFKSALNSDWIKPFDGVITEIHSDCGCLNCGGKVFHSYDIFNKETERVIKKVDEKHIVAVKIKSDTRP